MPRPFQTDSPEKTKQRIEELLASYSVPGGIQTEAQVVGWVFASFVAADAIKEEVTEWERQFDNFIDEYLFVRDKFEVEESIYIFQRVFSQTMGEIVSQRK